MTADKPPIVTARHRAVLLVQLTRPERRNALDLATMYALGAVCAEASADESVRALVLAARGPAFCAVWMMLSGESIAAADAYQFGLVTELAGEHDDVVARALAMAAVIAAQPPEAVRAAKTATGQSLGLLNHELLRAGDEAIARLTDLASASSGKRMLRS